MDISGSLGNFYITLNLFPAPRTKFVCFRYPCITPKAEYSEAKVYSGTLACARFLCGDRMVVTVGGTDASLMIWDLIEE